ncbi:hypothetical protein DY000_02010129 [Brassica cretica]|uniref:Uncharacterized protein n=1 Tax=Brassica cretica TaxID=69181 RepID=A0ABQ7C1A9_BRACR|nr:hypothetical protein DY000_02010129 [Brassica cretica]
MNSRNGSPSELGRNTSQLARQARPCCRSTRRRARRDTSQLARRARPCCRSTRRRARPRHEPAHPANTTVLPVGSPASSTVATISSPGERGQFSVDHSEPGPIL